MPRRCEITRNLCGTDTWEVLTPCKCKQCQAWLMVYCTNLQSHIKVLEDALKSLLPHVNETSPIGKIITQALEVKP
jgi:hypothetical protein